MTLQALREGEAVRAAFQRFGLLEGMSEGRHLQDLLQAVVTETLSRPELAAALEALAGAASFHLAHAAGVAALALVAAVRLGHEGNDLRRLGQAALLHDVGRARVPPGVWERPGPLPAPAREQVREHPRAGMELLAPAAGDPAAEVAYQHHERLDGSGYPRGLRGGQVGEFARIVAAADVLEALSAPRPHRPAVPVAYALSYLGGDQGRRFDPDVVRSLLRAVPPYPPGSFVELSSGAVAQVLGLDPRRPAVPVVQVRPGPGERPARIALARRPDLAVVRPLPAPPGGG